MNPDGAAEALNNDPSCEATTGKYNAHGIDLAINFPGKCAYIHTHTTVHAHKHTQKTYTQTNIDMHTHAHIRVKRQIDTDRPAQPSHKSDITHIHMQD